jgi:hypothetical protein
VDFTKLRLLSPLYYQSVEASARALNRACGGHEALFQFEISPAQAFAIEPDSSAYLGPLIAAGIGAATDAAGALILPAGAYFFTQTRSAGQYGAHEIAGLCTEMAVELQKEGLWERLKLEKTVYFRALWEDGAQVFQALRPFTV